MKITNLENGNISIVTPYNKEFVDRIKKLGGRWNAGDKAWEIDERSIEAVRKVMREVYGQDDRPQELVDVRVTIGKFPLYEDCGPVTLFGKIIASAFGRDSGARVGEGVAILSGGIESGGSRKNWKTVVLPGSEIMIYDVPKLAVEERIDWDDQIGTFEVIEKEDPHAALRAEKEALLARLAEINRLLGE
jgi:hypothetical protein